ncbi:MAG: agmatinase [Clostridia bacterium]|nr:MAG: agmatinase [Clostridia bacterium]
MALSPLRFLAAGSEADRARAVLAGVPLDVTTSYRPGTRFAPAAIRQASQALEEFSPRLQRCLAEVPFLDAGDLELPPGDVAAGLGLIATHILQVTGQGRVPVTLGGEHLLTWPVVQVMAARYPDLAVLQLDAHADLRAEYMGHELSHATVMYLVGRKIGWANLYQVGIRSATAEEWDLARKHTRFFPGNALTQSVVLAAEELAGRPVYVSIDIDVADPAAAPGTGTPEPGGPMAAELLEAVCHLHGLKVVGMDLVEVSPLAGPGDITALLAAKVLREALLSILA